MTANILPLFRIFIKLAPILINTLQVGAFLEIESVDTIATVYVNGQKVLHSRNQFLPYHVNVTDIIALGENDITIKFKSSVKYAEKRADEYKVRPFTFPK